MHKVDQTEFGEEKGNCFSACVASILELPIDDVPFFMAPGDWYPRFEEWLKPLGYYPVCFELEGASQSVMKEFGVHILSGKSPRGDFEHSVVACGDKVVHDPHPSRDGIGELVDYILIVRGIL